MEFHTLNIPATYAEHAGWYMCMAKNAAGSQISETQLIVESNLLSLLFYFHEFVLYFYLLYVSYYTIESNVVKLSDT